MQDKEASEHHGILGGIVCLQMGMGKTLVALAHTLASPRGPFPTLVVASKTIMSEWKSQGFEKFFPTEFKVCIIL